MSIIFPSSPTTGQTFSVGSKIWRWSGQVWDSISGTFNPGGETIPLDDLSNYFDGGTTRFLPTYQGNKVDILDPFKLLLSINGIIQVIDFPDYVWQSPINKPGIQLDNEGFLKFSEPVAPGTSFNARLLDGVASTKTTIYPFKAIDILLGA
jgi:hypothetical protein